MDAVMNKLKPRQRFKIEEKLRKELSETKSCFLTLYNNNPFYELEDQALMPNNYHHRNSSSDGDSFPKNVDRNTRNTS
jgi:hypothetical protein